jgi:hypothetical protein
MIPETKTEYLSLTETGKILGLNMWQVRFRVDKGEIKVMRLADGRRFPLRSSVEAYKKNQSEEEKLLGKRVPRGRRGRKNKQPVQEERK